MTELIVGWLLITSNCRCDSTWLETSVNHTRQLMDKMLLEMFEDLPSFWENLYAPNP